MTPTAIQLVAHPRPAWHPIVLSGRRAERPAVDASAPWRLGTMVVDSLSLLALAWSIPFVILLAGTPVALSIVLLLWLGRFAMNAF